MPGPCSTPGKTRKNRESGKTLREQQNRKARGLADNGGKFTKTTKEK